MEEQKTNEGEPIKDAFGDSGTTFVYGWYILKDYTLEETSAYEEYIFFHCDIDSMTIWNIAKEKKILFVNCKIKELEVKQSYLPHLRFIGCDLFNAKFLDSTLPGILFSGNGKNEQKYIKKITGKSIKQIYKSRIDFTTFLFCNINQMKIHDTWVFNTAFKHCQLMYMKIGDLVSMKSIDFSGTKISYSNFSNSSLVFIRFKKGYFILEFIWYFISLFIKQVNTYRIILPKIKNFRKKTKFLRFRLTPDEKEHLHRDVRKKVVWFRHFTKRAVYKVYIFNWMVDFLSSTELYDVKYREADFSKCHHFYRHIQSLEYVDGLIMRRPIFAFWYFILANYMRSVPSILFRLAFVVFLFSFLYQNHATFKFKVDLSEVRKDISGIIDNNGKPKNSFILSVKVFFNAGIYPLEPSDKYTELMLLLEIVIGYFTLAVLAGILSSHLFERFSDP